VATKLNDEFISVEEFSRYTGMNESEIKGIYTVEFGSQLLVPRFMMQHFDAQQIGSIDLFPDRPHNAKPIIDEQEPPECFTPVAEIPIDIEQFAANSEASSTQQQMDFSAQTAENSEIVMTERPSSRKSKRRKKSKKSKQRTFSRSELTTHVSPYRRLFARATDLFWETFLVLALAHYILKSFDASLMEIFETPLATVALALVLIPLSLLLDAVMFAVIGNTPGKAVFGLKVVSRKLKTIGFVKYLSRNLRLWHRALACGLIPLTFFYMAKEGIRAARGTETLYDQKERTRVSQPLMPSVMQPIMGFVMLALVIGLAAALALKTIEQALW